jgi:hypothetical protein
MNRLPAKPRAGRQASAPTLDPDALEAVAWIESGMPDDRVGYGPDAPKLTKEQRREFAPASYVRVPVAASGRRRRAAPVKQEE